MGLEIVVVLFMISCSNSTPGIYLPSQVGQSILYQAYDLIDVKYKSSKNITLHFRAEVEDFFRTMDRDFDQKLTFAEFMGEESHIEKLFKSMDKNNDGFVTKKVFTLTNFVS